MVFSSIPFLYCYFLPATLLLYFLAPARFKNAVLLLCSLFFYAWGEPRYVLLMAASVLLAYGFGLAIERSRTPLCRRVLTILSVSASLGFLLYFKYVDFFLSAFNAVTGLSVPLLSVALPIGISFYTFQIISYTVDVYRKQVHAQRNLIHLAAYVTMFPQLIAGPIVRYSDIASQLTHRTHTVEKAAVGVRRFAIGLSKKLLIADTLSALCDAFFASNDRSVLMYWLYAVAFSLQLYFDFSGYSDMAIGLGKLFGFDFPENFRYPFVSKSATEFWRRWHMTLGGWFRDYLYIPLGGNRCALPRRLLNLFIVWAATGLWHGAAWNFVVWGLYFGVLLLIEKLWLLPFLERSRVLSHLYLLLLVMCSFVLFNAADLSQAFSHIGALFGVGTSAVLSTESLFTLRQYAPVLLIAAIGATPLPKTLYDAVCARPNPKRVVDAAEPFVLLALVILCTAFLVGGSFHPFLYFRF